MGEHVGLVVKGRGAEITLVRPLVGVGVHVVAEVLQGVEPAGRIANRALVRLEKKVKFCFKCKLQMFF